MKQILKIAYRNVLRQRKRSLLLGSAVAFAMFVFTLLSGFTGGLRGNVSNNFADMLGGHLYVSGSEVSPSGREANIVRDTATLAEALTSVDAFVLSSNTRSSARVSVIFGSNQETLQLTGVSLDQEPAFPDSLTLVEGSAERFAPSPSSILLPEEVVADLGVELGESVTVRTTTVTGQQNVGEAVVVGSLAAQGNLIQGVPSTGYAHLPALNELLGVEARQYQTLNLTLRDLDDLATVTGTLQAELERLGTVEPRDEGGSGLPDPSQLFSFSGSVDEAERWQGTKYKVTNLSDRISPIAALVTLMNALGGSVFAVILVIIMVGLTNAYRMVMLERVSEIGTMRAVGVQRSDIRNIFLWEAALVALGGAVVGLGLALLAMGGLSFVNLGAEGAFGPFLDQGRLSFVLPLLTPLSNVTLICLLCASAVYLPARAAARLQPADALRA